MYILQDFFKAIAGWRLSQPANVVVFKEEVRDDTFKDSIVFWFR